MEPTLIWLDTFWRERIDLCGRLPSRNESGLGLQLVEKPEEHGEIESPLGITASPISLIA